MLAPAHAHAAEVATQILRDRAIARLATITQSFRARGVTDYARDLGEREWRRYLRAQVAVTTYNRTLYARQARHSYWYRAILRARRARS